MSTYWENQKIKREALQAGLKLLKVGDEVVVHSHYNRQICKVEKFTPKFIVIGNRKYRIENGQEWGGDKYHAQHLTLDVAGFRAELVEKNRLYTMEQKIKTHIGEFNNRIDTTLLEKLHAAVLEYEAEISAKAAAILEVAHSGASGV